MEPVESKLFIHNTPDETIVTFNDEQILEEEHIRELGDSIMRLVDDPKNQNIILDFSNVRFMSSSFLGLLVKIHKRICERNGHLKLCNIAKNIYKIFEITQLNKIFDISCDK